MLKLKQKTLKTQAKNPQNSGNQTQNSSKKLNGSANSFGWVAENRSKLEAWVSSIYVSCNIAERFYPKIAAL